MNYNLKKGAVTLISALICASSAWAAPVVDFTGTIKDLSDLPQDVSAYLPKDGVDEPYLSPEVQNGLMENFLVQYFSPWTSDEDVELNNEWGLKSAKKDRWGENLMPIPQSVKDKIVADASMGSYPSMDSRAIVVANTSARFLPTMRPFFANPDEAGEGFPFDYLQNTAHWVGVPLRVRHTNATGDWLLARSGTIPGWIPARDVAFVDDYFMTAYRTGRYAALVKDDVVLRDEDGAFLAKTNIGAVLPIVQEGDDSFVVYVPIRSEGGMARLKRAVLSKDYGVEMPKTLTPQAIATLANRFVGNPYGWGGMYDQRDCSSTMRDLLTPFGLWLPRDSGPQSKSNVFIDIEQEPWDKKPELIAEKALPLRTIIGMKGHVGLYLGLWDGKPVILHNTWGVRLTTDNPEVSGRAILGRTVVTTLQPGIERDDVAKEGLLPKVRTITFIPGFDGTEN